MFNIFRDSAPAGIPVRISNPQRRIHNWTFAPPRGDGRAALFGTLMRGPTPYEGSVAYAGEIKKLKGRTVTMEDGGTYVLGRALPSQNPKNPAKALRAVKKLLSDLHEKPTSKRRKKPTSKRRKKEAKLYWFFLPVPAINTGRGARPMVVAGVTTNKKLRVPKRPTKEKALAFLNKADFERDDVAILGMVYDPGTRKVSVDVDNKKIGHHPDKLGKVPSKKAPKKPPVVRRYTFRKGKSLHGLDLQQAYDKAAKAAGL